MITIAATAIPDVAAAQTTPNFEGVEALYPENSPTTLTHVDLDGNGIGDVVTANRAGGDQGLGSISIFLVTKGGVLSEPIHINLPEGDSYPRGIVAVDLDNDDDMDLVTVNWNSDSFTVFVNDGSANFSTYSLSTLNGPTAIDAFDYNNDGLMDIVATSSSDLASGRLQVYRNNGNHTYSLVIAYSIPAQPRDIAIGDLDGDEQPDIGVACRGDDTIELRFNNGNGVFTDSVAIEVGLKPRSLVFADLDDDGDQDIAVAMFMDPDKSGETWIIENQGRREFEVVEIIHSGVAPHTVAAADLDHDCDIDLMVGHVGDRNMRMLINENNNLSFSNIAVPMTAVVAEVLLVDLDADERPDVLAGHPTASGASTGLLSIRRNVTPPCEACSDSIGTNDCNNNGVPDVCDISQNDSQDCNGNSVPDFCDILNQTSIDINSNGIPDECDTVGCPADLNNSGLVEIGDFSLLLIGWGCVGPTCQADINRDGQVDVGDFSVLLLTFGAPCATN